MKKEQAGHFEVWNLVVMNPSTVQDPVGASSEAAQEETIVGFGVPSGSDGAPGCRKRTRLAEDVPTGV